MTETKQEPETTKEEPKPVGFYEKPDYFYSFSTKEVQMLRQLLAPFEIASAVLNMHKDLAFQNGGIVPVYEKDVIKDENGVLQVKQTFIESLNKTKTLTVEETKN